MSEPFIRKADLWDALDLAAEMRECDVQEIHHSSRRTPDEALRLGLSLGECWAVEWRGHTVAMFGVSGVPGRIGAPWMLATDDLQHIRRPFIRQCREVVDGWLHRYGYLTNSCWSRNEVHIRWIKWLGFAFQGTEVRNGETFLHFHRSTHV